VITSIKQALSCISLNLLKRVYLNISPVFISRVKKNCVSCRHWNYYLINDNVVFKCDIGKRKDKLKEGREYDNLSDRRVRHL